MSFSFPNHKVTTFLFFLPITKKEKFLVRAESVVGWNFVEFPTDFRREGGATLILTTSGLFLLQQQLLNNNFIFPKEPHVVYLSVYSYI